MQLRQLGVVYSAASEARSVWMPRSTKLDQILFSTLRDHRSTVRKVIAVGPAEVQGLDAEFSDMNTAMPAVFAAYRATIVDEGQRALWSTFEAKWQDYLQVRRPLIEAMTRGDREAATAAVAPARAPLVAAFEAVNPIVEINEAGLQASMLEAENAYSAAWRTALAMAAIAAAVLLGFTFWISRSTAPAHQDHWRSRRRRRGPDLVSHRASSRRSERSTAPSRPSRVRAKSSRRPSLRSTSRSTRWIA